MKYQKIYNSKTVEPTPNLSPQQPQKQQPAYTHTLSTLSTLIDPLDPSELKFSKTMISSVSSSASASASGPAKKKPRTLVKRSHAEIDSTHDDAAPPKADDGDDAASVNSETTTSTGMMLTTSSPPLEALVEKLAEIREDGSKKLTGAQLANVVEAQTAWLQHMFESMVTTTKKKSKGSKKKGKAKKSPSTASGFSDLKLATLDDLHEFCLSNISIRGSSQALIEKLFDETRREKPTDDQLQIFDDFIKGGTGAVTAHCFGIRGPQIRIVMEQLKNHLVDEFEKNCVQESLLEYIRQGDEKGLEVMVSRAYIAAFVDPELQQRRSALADFRPSLKGSPAISVNVDGGDSTDSTLKISTAGGLASIDAYCEKQFGTWGKLEVPAQKGKTQGLPRGKTGVFCIYKKTTGLGVSKSGRPKHKYTILATVNTKDVTTDDESLVMKLDDVFFGGKPYSATTFADEENLCLTAMWRTDSSQFNVRRSGVAVQSTMIDNPLGSGRPAADDPQTYGDLQDKSLDKVHSAEDRKKMSDSLSGQPCIVMKSFRCTSDVPEDTRGFVDGEHVNMLVTPFEADDDDMDTMSGSHNCFHVQVVVKDLATIICLSTLSAIDAGRKLVAEPYDERFRKLMPSPQAPHQYVASKMALGQKKMRDLVQFSRFASQVIVGNTEQDDDDFDIEKLARDCQSPSDDRIPISISQMTSHYNQMVISDDAQAKCSNLMEFYTQIAAPVEQEEEEEPETEGLTDDDDDYESEEEEE